MPSAPTSIISSVTLMVALSKGPLSVAGRRSVRGLGKGAKSQNRFWKTHRAPLQLWGNICLLSLAVAPQHAGTCTGADCVDG